MRIEIIRTKRDLLQEAKDLGFRKGCKYENSEGEILIAAHDPQWFCEDSGKIMLGRGDGIISKNFEITGTIITPADF